MIPGRILPTDNNQLLLNSASLSFWDREEIDSLLKCTIFNQIKEVHQYRVPIDVIKKQERCKDNKSLTCVSMNNSQLENIHQAPAVYLSEGQQEISKVWEEAKNLCGKPLNLGYTTENICSDSRSKGIYNKVHHIFGKAGNDGFKLLTHQEKLRYFGGKRDDLFYKTFVRDVRKFWQDNVVESEENKGALITYRGYNKEMKGKGGLYFYNCLKSFEEIMQLSKGQDFSSERMVCYLGSLINHREFIKAWPKHLKRLSDNIHNVFSKFTKERLYKLWQTPEFKVLFKHYASWVNESNNFERLRTHKTIGSNLAPYMIIYKEFVRVWINNLF